MITDAQIQALKRRCLAPNYGARYIALDECLEVIEAYEAVTDELQKLREEAEEKGEQMKMFQEVSHGNPVL